MYGVLCGKTLYGKRWVIYYGKSAPETHYILITMSLESFLFYVCTTTVLSAPSGYPAEEPKWVNVRTVLVVLQNNKGHW